MTVRTRKNKAQCHNQEQKKSQALATIRQRPGISEPSLCRCLGFDMPPGAEFASLVEALLAEEVIYRERDPYSKPNDPYHLYAIEYRGRHSSPQRLHSDSEGCVVKQLSPTEAAIISRQLTAHKPTDRTMLKKSRPKNTSSDRGYDRNLEAFQIAIRKMVNGGHDWTKAEVCGMADLPIRYIDQTPALLEEFDKAKRLILQAKTIQKVDPTPLAIVENFLNPEGEDVGDSEEVRENIDEADSELQAMHSELASAEVVNAELQARIKELEQRCQELERQVVEAGDRSLGLQIQDLIQAWSVEATRREIAAQEASEKLRQYQALAATLKGESEQLIVSVPERAIVLANGKHN